MDSPLKFTSDKKPKNFMLLVILIPVLSKIINDFEI